MTPDHFNEGWGGKAGIPIIENIAHELMHVASGFNGGGREAECIVHCLTKRCNNSSHDFSKLTVGGFRGQEIDIACHKIVQRFWKGKEDIANEMDAGDCFCGIKWVENANCDETIPTPTSNTGKKKRNDAPDDHYSFAAGINYITNILSTTVFDFPIEGKRNFISFNFYPDILIYEKYFGDVQNLLNKYGEFYISDYVHDYFSNNHKILFIGSGELIGDEKSAIIKQALENFVANGGVLFAQTQQYSSQIQDLVPVPENESLRFIGFRQDQSCVRNSGYFRSIHPAVSSSTTELLDMGLDGYFPVYPSNSTVLIKRRISQEPSLLYYPYKNGRVILGANFTDYSLSKSMASTAELKIARDLLVFAKNPGLPILMVSLEQEPIPTITRDVTVRNPTEDTAVKAILKVYTPDKDQILYETQQNITLNPGDHGEIPVSFSLPGVTPDMYGIWHVFYELYNSDNDLIYAEESDAGRFALYKITEEYTSNQPVSAWITVQDELLYFSEPAAFEFHLKNNTTESKTLDLKYTWNHQLFKTDLQTITIPAGEQVDLQFDIDAPPIAHYVSAYRGGKAAMLFRLWYAPTQIDQFNQATKGIQFMTLKTESSIVQIQPDKVPVGKPFSYTIKVINESDSEIVDAAITVTLEKLEWPENNYIQVSKLYETLHTFTAGETFSYKGNYIPTTPHESGMYRLKMEVQKPEGTREENYGNFLYINSNIGVSVEPLTDTDLVAGTTYPVKILLTKKSFFDVLNGRYSILFKTPDGQTACRKDVENLVLKGYHSIPIEDVIAFNPAILAPYYRLVVEYSDETILTPRSIDSGKRYQFKYSAALTLDKEVYLYRETANVSLNLRGAGTFDVHFTCANAGIDEQRVVTIPTDSTGTVEVFQVPIGMETYYNTRFTITSREGLYPTFGGQLRIPIPVLPLKLEANGTFAEITAKVEKPIEFNLTIKGISGLGSPLPGLLKVSLMDYTDVQNVTLSPQGDNNFYYHIPVGSSIDPGIYNTDVTFEHEDRVLISKNYPIKIPAPGIKFSAPPTQLAAGDSFLLSLENPGGISGNYQWEVYLKDPKGKTILEYAPGSTFPINAGEKKEITLEITGDAANGRYFLFQKVKEIITASQEVYYSWHQLSGVSAALNSYTLKEKYFADEVVSGKSEISPGNGDIANGSLQAEIVKIEDNTGIEKIYDWVNCITVDSQNRLWVGTDSGVSRYEDGSWQAYTQLPDTAPIGMVLDITAGPADKIYALTFDGIVVITDNGAQMSEIPFYSSYHDWHLDILAVDKFSRIWMIYVYQGDFIIYDAVYYDETGWHIYDAEDLEIEAKTIHCDGSGGVWLISPHSLIHIKSDLSWEFWDEDSGVPVDDILFSYVDVNGVVWFNSAFTGKLYSFDPNAMVWTDYSIKPGYPPAMAAVTGDESGNIYGIGIMENYQYSIYRLQNNEFIGGAVEFDTWSYNGMLDLVVIAGNVYINGSLGSPGGEGEGNGEFISGLLKISAGSGTGPQTVWSQTYAVEAGGGSLLTLDLNPGTTFEPGFYILKTRLFSSLEQLLSESSDTFIVRDSDVSVSLFANCSPDGFVKAGSQIPVKVEVLNNTTETISGLELLVKKVSPAGEEEIMISETLTLTPGQLETDSITFNETDTGTWKIAAGLNDNSSSEPVVLSSSELVIGVVEPTVTMEITAPQYAGDESFDVNIKLFNQGNIPTEVTTRASLEGDSETLLEETLILSPLEERILTLNDTITADKTYAIALTGDIEKTETKTVKYGYVENFSMDIQPAYREGMVSIGYTLGNGGGLAFTDQVHFELFAVGGTLPLYVVDRDYHLYPDQAPIMDTIGIPLLPGNYQLNYHTSKQPQVQTALFVVQPSGVGNIVINPSSQYPVGAADITYSITNIDTFAGQVPVTLTLTGSEPGEPLLTETRGYYLLPGETQNDVFHYEFDAAGNYTLNFTGAKLPAPVNSIIRVMNLEQVTASISIGQVETDSIPVNVTLENNGYQAFTGTVVIEIGGIHHEEIIDVSPGSSFAGTVSLNTSVLTPGTKEVKAFLYDNAGNAIAQTTGTIVIQPADIKLIDYPENLEISAGSFGEVTLTLKNEGNLRGEAVLKINTFDTLYQEMEIVLEAGEEVQLDDIFIEAPPDLASGSYPFYYSLKGSGVENGTTAGNFNFKVNGLSLDIDASLDRSLYNPGETAVLTLDVTAETASDAPLEAVVNWGIFSETREFNLNSGSESLVFDIPLDQARVEKVFYGIYHGGDGGKGIHLNDIYLHFRGEISVETDKQVYAPGEIVHAVFTGEHTGVLTVSAFDESYTLDFSSSASASFQAPIDTLGGTYGISWCLSPSDPSKSELSGSYSFDVSGLKVKVAKSELEKGKYAPGDTINAHYIFESNRDQTLKLRSWVVPPSGDWTYLGESSVTVSSQQQVDAMSGYSFNTTEAGTHELVYGLYLSGSSCNDCDRLVVSGRLSFDVGNAVLLGINTDQWEYKNGNEPVTLRIDYFGEGFSQLQVYLDEENVHQQGITLSGTGSTEVVLESSGISGGSHRIKAVLIQNNLTSTKTTGFTYGTHLPDLTAWLTDTLQDGLNYTFKIEVSNMGKTASTATSMVFSDNGADVGTASLPALQPSQSYEVIFNWNGTGKAGSHELIFEVDSSDSVKEFSEINNNIESTLEVPALFYTLETDPPDKLIYPANTPINMISRLINNQETPILLTLDLSITNDESGVVIHNQIKEEQIPAFDSKIINDTFNTSVYPAGNYSLSQTLSSDNVNMLEEVFLYFEPTRIVTGSLQVELQQIPAKTPTEVKLTMTLKNAGNVPLEDEILQIDVFNKDLGEVAISEDLTVSIPLAEEITETKTMTLNLVEGNYEIWLKHNEEIISLADLSALSAVKPNQTIGIHPRVLIMNINEKFLRTFHGTGAVFSSGWHPHPTHGQPDAVLSEASSQKFEGKTKSQKVLIERTPAQSNNLLQFLTGLLQSQGIEYEVGFRLLDSYVKLNKGQANVNIVLGNEMGRNLRDELKEKVWHGEGLILFCDTPTQNPEWVDFLGVTIKPIPGKTRETIIQILPNEFCSEGEIECTGKLRLQLTKKQEDVLIIAQTKQKQYPVIAYRKYGKGHILMVAVPLEFKSGMEHMAQLLLNTITKFSQDIYTGSDLTRLLPLELSLKNESSQDKTLKIIVLLPYGVEGFDYQPQPEEGEELKWTLTIPALSTKTISYWIKLPDQINSFEIMSELYEDETKLDEVSISFEVSQVVLYRLNELILELESMSAVGKDAQLIHKAAHHLEKMRDHTGDSLLEDLLNLHDSIKAAVYLGDVRNIDVSIQRFNIQDIMVVMGRRFYEKVKTWAENRLIPFLKIIED